MLIGVFDSGIGGQAIAIKLQNLLPDAKIISINDHENMPYGNKDTDKIIELTKKAIKPLVQKKCDAIVIACNTATTVAINELRTSFPDVNFIGVEPMIKPAATITKSGHIAVCATARTLGSDRYIKLKKTWAANIDVIEPDCSDWAELIEMNQSKKIDVDLFVKKLIKQKVDVIVLGCTHYHWIKSRIEDTAGPNVTILEPSDAITNRIKSLVNS